MEIMEYQKAAKYPDEEAPYGKRALPHQGWYDQMNTEGNQVLLFYSLFGKISGYKIFIRNTFRKFTGFFQDIL